MDKYLRKNEDAERRFSFLDGPITANNPMGVHHAWGRTLKDLYQRFNNMCGFKERFQNGFDNQGLWVEVEVEKKLGFESKKDIEKYGIAEFVEKCKEHTRHFAGVQIEQSKRLGYFMDWGNDYFTMSEENNYAIWHFLKTVWENGNLYQGRDSVPWCPRCGTAISQHEILTEEYQELTHDSVFFKLPLTSRAVETFTSRSEERALKGATPSETAQLSNCPTASLLVWTTTPWTIPGNMAVAVDPDLDYWLWKMPKGSGDSSHHSGASPQDAAIESRSVGPDGNGSSEYIIFADPNQETAKEGSEEKDSHGHELNALDVVKDGEKLAVIKGEELIGLSYCAPYADLPAAKKVTGKNKYKVVEADPMILTVDPSEGTGLVHIAPGCGSEDFQLGQEEDIPALPVIDESANYLEGFGELTGKNAKDHPELILDELKTKTFVNDFAAGDKPGLSFDNPGLEECGGGKPNPFFHKIVPYTHRYPTCWRCKSELVWRVVDEWYIAMDDERKEGARDYRSKLKEIIKDVEWIPEFGYKRELDWLNNMHDWLISKKRYWGLCLPIWVCEDCNYFEVIGSREELEERAVIGWDEFEGHTPHRPYVDKVKIKCSKCDGVAKRIKDVGNPWLDAGIVAYSTLKYFEDRGYWESWFPADLVVECFPGQFKNWFYSLLAMSTVLEKKAPFKTLLGHGLVKDEHGEEMHKSKGNAIWFDDAAEEMGVDPMRWLYATQDPSHNLNFGYGPAREVKRRFLFILWNSFKYFVTYARLDNFDPNEAMQLPEQKAAAGKTRRVKTDKPDGLGNAAVEDYEQHFTLDTYNLHVIDRWIISRSNEAFKEAKDYLESYQNQKATQVLEDFVVKDLSTWYIRRIRGRVGPTAPDGDDKFCVYQTLYAVLIRLTKVLSPFIPFMTEEMYQVLMGPQDVEGEKSDVFGKLESVHLTSWPKYHDYLTDEEVIKKMEIVREICEKGHAARREAGIKVRQPLQELQISNFKFSIEEEYLQIIKDELNVKEVTFEEGKGELEVALDTEITDELRLEGTAREMIRNIQKARKKAGCEWDDKIIATYPDTEENKTAVVSFADYIKQQTLAVQLQPGEDYSVKVV